MMPVKKKFGPRGRVFTSTSPLEERSDIKLPRDIGALGRSSSSISPCGALSIKLPARLVGDLDSTLEQLAGHSITHSGGGLDSTLASAVTPARPPWCFRRDSNPQPIQLDWTAPPIELPKQTLSTTCNAPSTASVGPQSAQLQLQ